MNAMQRLSEVEAVGRDVGVDLKCRGQVFIEGRFLCLLPSMPPALPLVAT